MVKILSGRWYIGQDLRQPGLKREDLDFGHWEPLRGSLCIYWTAIKKHQQNEPKYVLLPWKWHLYTASNQLLSGWFPSEIRCCLMYTAWIMCPRSAFLLQGSQVTHAAWPASNCFSLAGYFEVHSVLEYSFWDRLMLTVDDARCHNVEPSLSWLTYYYLTGLIGHSVSKTISLCLLLLSLSLALTSSLSYSQSPNVWLDWMKYMTLWN